MLQETEVYKALATNNLISYWPVFLLLSSWFFKCTNAKVSVTITLKRYWNGMLYSFIKAPVGAINIVKLSLIYTCIRANGMRSWDHHWQSSHQEYIFGLDMGVDKLLET